MKEIRTRLAGLLFLMLGLSVFAGAQTDRQALDIALRYLSEHQKEWGYAPEDIADVVVSDLYTDRSTGITRVYLKQRYQGIEVYNAINNFNISKEGEVFFVGRRFVSHLADKVNTTTPALTAEAGVAAALQHLGLAQEGTLRLAARPDAHHFVFENETVAREDIHVALVLAPTKDQGVRLAWDVLLAPAGSHDKWSMRIDATTGELLDKDNWTIYCTAGGVTRAGAEAAVREVQQQENMAPVVVTDGAAYNVFAIPLESPAHGPRTLVVNPHDSLASPYGWHDTNGEPGPEYTITRGNNVHAYQDRQDNGSSQGDEPDGGPDLIFDFFYDDNAEPDSMIDAAVTNLFYMSNVIHDLTYHYGFDEAAGNFQENTYGRGGLGGDPLIARAQAGAETGSTNNAFYSHANDGASGSINMFVWTTAGARFLTVNAPDPVAGVYETGTASGWGAPITEEPVTGEVAIVDDGVFEPLASDGCEEILNGDELAGKIALIDRGGCQFGTKALKAEQNGAIGVIICNFEDDLVTMGAGVDGGSVTIPVVFISSVDCQTIRQYVGQGLEVSLVAPPQSGPDQLDGDFDNGIIAHEYGHGISTRLTGGPSTACLGNAEQMGEGWSDFMTLITSVRPGDVGAQRRGVGTFVMRQPNDGRGIRRYPYSTDMSINPLTYGDVAANTQVHAVGEVWASMLWDLYWAFVDEYGYDPDWYNGTGGNNMAVRLVFEGMKNQPCFPGFVDGRDAILAADEALFGGANQCLIWEVFARRGLGYYADQGDSDNAADQTESFEPYPLCIPELKISKEMTEFIEAGDDIEVTIRVVNHKPETLTGVTVTDEIPAGTVFKQGSSNVPATVDGNTVIFDLGTMNYQDEVTITYQLMSDAGNYSITWFLDDVPTEDAEDNWDFYYIGNPAPNIWQITDALSHSPDYSWSVEDIEGESRQVLELLVPWTVEGNQPALRFYHYYETEAGFDGGVVDISTDGGSTWQQVGDKMFKNGYPGFIAYGTFVVPNLQAFSGNSGGFIPTYVDLSEYAGQTIRLRFRFGTDEQVAGLGWFVDDVEFMDLVSYNGTACVTSDQGDQACAAADGKGTLVESAFPTSTEEVAPDFRLGVWPNPTDGSLTLGIRSDEVLSLTATVTTADGREVMSRHFLSSGNETHTLDLSDLPSGIYFLKLQSDRAAIVRKLIVE